MYATNRVQEARERALRWPGDSGFMGIMKRRAQREGWLPTPAEASKILHYPALEAKPAEPMPWSTSRRSTAEDFLRDYSGTNRYLADVARWFKSTGRLTDKQVDSVLRSAAKVGGMNLSRWG